MPGGKQKCPASDDLRKMSHRSLRKQCINTEKSLTLIGKLNERNALFHYRHYRKPPSGVVNVQLTCLRWRWSAKELGVGSRRRQAFELSAIRTNFTSKINLL